MFRNGAKTAVLLAALGGVMVGVGSLFGRGGAIIGLILGLAVVGFSYWKSDTLAIRAARAVPADEAHMPEYYAIMRELTSNAQMPMPRLYVSPEAQPNAFATGRNPNHAAVAVTAGLLQVCTWDEVRGVLANELAHIRNRDILIGSVAAAVGKGPATSTASPVAHWSARRSRTWRRTRHPSRPRPRQRQLGSCGSDDPAGSGPPCSTSSTSPTADRGYLASHRSFRSQPETRALIRGFSSPC